ncbi:MAG: hypothetical protein H7837_05530 [Magnetococcus sp. MYC-9]
MSETSSVAGEGWRRVAGLRCTLRPTVRSWNQTFRGERWRVICDPFSDRFFRLRPDAWNFVARLRRERTVEEVWQESREQNPARAPNRDEAAAVLLSLIQANLVAETGPREVEQLLQRHEKRRQQRLTARFMGIASQRIPLFNPDAWLAAMLPWVGPMLGRWGALVWAGVLLAGVKAVVEHWDRLWDQAQGVIAPTNLLFLYLSFALLKSCHELGHALVCRHQGGAVHKVGIQFVLLVPMPYVDATTSWALHSRWRRILVASSGMLTEFFLAALAALYWSQSGEGLLHAIAYNTMFVATVSTILFNANPLLRYDGYYILSDLLEIPNLSQRSQKQITYLLEKYLLGLPRGQSPADTPRVAFWLTLYGITSGIYRPLLLGSILLFVVDKYFILGVLMGLSLLFSLMVVPFYRLVRYLATSPALAQHRTQATARVVGSLLVLFMLVAWLPWPNTLRAPGVVEAEQHRLVIVDTPGRLVEILSPSGQRVVVGDPLFRLENFSLPWDLRVAQAQQEELRVMQRRAGSEKSADLAPLAEQLLSISAHIATLEGMIEALTVRARQEGVWVANTGMMQQGRWMSRGEGVGWTVDPGGFRFTAVAPQEGSSELFSGPVAKAEVRLNGQEGENVVGGTVRILPYRHQQLPSMALGWMGGGQIPVAPEDKSGMMAAEPFFLIHVTLPPAAGAQMAHGRTGEVRLTLPGRPLLQQWLESWWAFVQRRYQL